VKPITFNQVILNIFETPKYSDFYLSLIELTCDSQEENEYSTYKESKRFIFQPYIFWDISIQD
jgi:hypothetical protein